MNKIFPSDIKKESEKENRDKDRIKETDAIRIIRSVVEQIILK